MTALAIGYVVIAVLHFVAMMAIELLSTRKTPRLAFVVALVWSCIWPLFWPVFVCLGLVSAIVVRLAAWRRD